MAKKSSKVIGGLLIGLGAVLVGMAGLLCWHNFQESNSAAEASQADLSLVQAAIAEKKDAGHLDAQMDHINPFDYEAVEEAKEMTEVTINGYTYIGYISFPQFDIELPVMSQWSYHKLRIAPCRQFGSTKTDDLVIAAHNYPVHFGKLREADWGSKIYFTDMDGEKITYVVDNVTTIDPDAIEEVRDSGYDLVLYTCTYGGASRVMCGCYRESSEFVPAPTKGK